MASPGKDNYRMKSYKNKALNPQEMRRRREEEGIQLRKQKREEQVGVLRHLAVLGGHRSVHPLARSVSREGLHFNHTAVC